MTDSLAYGLVTVAASAALLAVASLWILLTARELRRTQRELARAVESISYSLYYLDSSLKILREARGLPSGKKDQ